VSESFYQFLQIKEIAAMYAIVTDGAKQLKVEEGQVLDIDYRPLSAGEKITFDRVLAIGGEGGEARIGQPAVAGASVTAEVIGPTQGKKLFVQKFRRRKNSKRRTGHRQLHMQIKISKILA
jgi:large subunit ribosomal protein L21